jgi:RHS repeat-associated protein
LHPYNAASELEKSELNKVAVATYTYNEVGDRTKTKPTAGPATTYAYNQAEDVTSVTRPKEGEVPAIEDTYGYNGDGLRTSQTIGVTTTYLAWDVAQSLPVILNDGTNSYIFGPTGAPVEQISGGGTVLYIHHDQQGSTRLLTNTTGENAGSTTYDTYGNVIEHKGANTSALGYGGQYTDGDTGLIYLRARYYEPATAQFISADPAVERTLERYGYGGADPVNRADPTGTDSPTSDEIAFSNSYTHVRNVVERRLRDRGTREDFEEAANYYYFAVRAEIAYQDDNLTYGAFFQSEAQKRYAELSKALLGNFSSLLKAEATSGWWGVVKELAALVKKIYNIRVVVHHP